MANPARPGRDRKSAKRGPGKRIVEGGGIRLADEVRYIQHRAANHDGRIVTIGPLVLFSTETGDAWLLDRTDFAGTPEQAIDAGCAALARVLCCFQLQNRSAGRATDCSSS